MIFRKRIPVFLNTLRIIKGYFFCKIISIAKGNRSPVFLVSGRDEDVFLYCSLLGEYLEEAGVRKFTVLSDNDILNEIKYFYPSLTGHFMKISSKMEKAVQHAAIFFGYKRLSLDSPKMRYDDLTYNACAVRSAFPFSLYEYYNLMIFQSEKKGLKQDRALFPKIQKDILQKIKDRGLVAGRTVILSPYSDMVKETETFFWTVIKKELEKRGYIVFIIDTRQRKRYRLENTDIKFSWEMAINLIEMAENYIGVKSSLSSMVSEMGGGVKKSFYIPFL